MEISCLLFLAIVITLFDYCLIQRKLLGDLKYGNFLHLIRPHGWKQTLCYILIPLTLFSLVSVSHFLYKADLVFTVNRALVIGFLWPIAITDFCEYRIPNKMLALALILRAVVFILELFVYGRKVFTVLINEGIAAIGAIIICVLCMLIARGGVGLGDLKLMAVMALYLGVEGICYAMFLSVFSAFLISVILLLTRKRKHTDAIPFAPFILVGTFLSFILTGT